MGKGIHAIRSQYIKLDRLGRVLENFESPLEVFWLYKPVLSDGTFWKDGNVLYFGLSNRVVTNHTRLLNTEELNF